MSLTATPAGLRLEAVGDLYGEKKGFLRATARGYVILVSPAVKSLLDDEATEEAVMKSLVVETDDGDKPLLELMKTLI